MPNWLPNWNTTEWATAAAVASAVFTAMAAGAAWRSTLVSLRLQRLARVPHVSGAVTHNRTTGSLGLTFANAGPVLAVQVVYLVVVGDRKDGGAVSDGHLSVGEKWTAQLPWRTTVPSYLVWGWRDLDDNVYFRSDRWVTKRISRRRYLRRKRTTLGDMFKEMYPAIPVP